MWSVAGKLKSLRFSFPEKRLHNINITKQSHTQGIHMFMLRSQHKKCYLFIILHHLVIYNYAANLGVFHPDADTTAYGLI